LQEKKLHLMAGSDFKPNKDVFMSVTRIEGGSGAISNLFCNAQSSPSKWEKAREAGMAAKKNQQNAFAGQMQSLVQSTAAQMNSWLQADQGSKYTNALKIRNRVEQGVNVATTNEVRKASEANLDEIKEQIEANAKGAQERSAQEAKENGEAQTGSQNGNAAPDTTTVVKSASPDQSADIELELPGSGEQSVSTSKPPSSSSGGSRGGTSGGRVHIDVLV
jgi:hypothetical protein